MAGPRAARALALHGSALVLGRRSARSPRPHRPQLLLGRAAHADGHLCHPRDEPRHPARIHRAAVARPRRRLRRGGLRAWPCCRRRITPGSGPAWPAASSAGCCSAPCLGLLVSHVRDVYFLMITLALGMVLWGVSYRWIPVTGGDNGISGIPRLEAHAGLPVLRRGPVLLRRAAGVRGVRGPDGARRALAVRLHAAAAFGKTSRA